MATLADLRKASIVNRRVKDAEDVRQKIHASLPDEIKQHVTSVGSTEFGTGKTKLYTSPDKQQHVIALLQKHNLHNKFFPSS